MASATGWRGGPERGARSRAVHPNSRACGKGRRAEVEETGWETARPLRPKGSHSDRWCYNDGGASALWRRPPVDRRLEVAAPIEVGSHLRSSQLVQGDAVAAGRPKRTARPWGISKVRCRSQPWAASSTRAAPRSATRYTMIGRSPSRWSANSTSGGPSVSWTAATLVPIASTAKTTRPPRTSVKYPRSAATSRRACTRSRAAGKVRAGQSWPVTAMSGASPIGHGTPRGGATARRDQTGTPSDRVGGLGRR